MRIYNEESKKKATNNKSPLSPTSSTSSTSSTYGISHHYSSSDLDSSGQFCPQISKVHIPLVFNKNKPNISMYRFINSKGKQATKENGHNSFYIDNDFGELRPPRYVTGNHQFFRKRLSAIDKIQEELREMKQREDELRCQRVRSIGLSYPNLSSICDEDFNSDAQTIESSEENKDSFHSRCSSNPDLLNSRDAMETPTESDLRVKVGGPRRKIPLIALWEQRIQEVNEKK